MALIWRALLAIFHKPTVADVLLELSLFSAPLWLAALAGLVLGWAWRPRWACAAFGDHREEQPASPIAASPATEAQAAVGEEDLERLWRLVEERDGGPAWIKMMERSLPGFRHQAWRRDPETGPPEYRSSTVFEDAVPEIVRDFFWDDEFRTKDKWDGMLLYHETLEECPTTGTMVVRWIRKFPFFCSDREYIIGRRIWQSGRTFYCVTKGVQRPSIPRHNKPRRIDLYYSSWCIRPVESARGNGQRTACEVLLFHQEDMGIPREIAKLGVRQGMWGFVTRIEPGLRAYQNSRDSGEPVSCCASTAHINTKFTPDELSRRTGDTSSPSEEIKKDQKPKHWTRSIPRLAVVGGAIVLACTVDRRLVTRAVIFGVARKFAKLGGRF